MRLSSFIPYGLGYQFLFRKKQDALAQRQRIVNTLHSANEAIPYYKGRFSEFLARQGSLDERSFRESFVNLPIVTKNDLIEYNQDFLPSRFVNKTDLLAGGGTPSLWQALWHGLIKKDFYTSLSTGGTSGRSTFRWVDYDDADSFAESFFHSFQLNGWRKKEPFVVFYPLRSYFTGAYADHAKTLDQLFGFTMTPFEEITLDSVQALLNALRARKATLLVIFPCVLQRVAEIMREHDIPPVADLPYINVSGEFLLDCSKRFIQDMFPNSDIQSTYGAVEFGEIAHQHKDSAFHYEIFSDYAYVEQGPRDENGMDTLLVTALQQNAFPLIRYQIEDKAQVEERDGMQFLMQLEGKNTDFLTGTDGVRYYASYFNTAINAMNAEIDGNIIHFMLRHNEDGLHLNFVLKSKNESDKKAIHTYCTQSFTALFSGYGQIHVRFPDHFDHDYTRKFKILSAGDGLGEVVGGYYQHKAAS